MLDWARRQNIRIMSKYASAFSVVAYGCCTGW